MTFIIKICDLTWVNLLFVDYEIMYWSGAIVCFWILIKMHLKISRKDSNFKEIGSPWTLRSEYLKRLSLLIFVAWNSFFLQSLLRFKTEKKICLALQKCQGRKVNCTQSNKILQKTIRLCKWVSFYLLHNLTTH